jgi:hypothetical protein
MSIAGAPRQKTKVPEYCRRFQKILDLPDNLPLPRPGHRVSSPTNRRSFELPDIPLPYRWLIVLAYVAIIVALSIAPGVAQPDDTIFSWLVVFTAAPVQKALHFVIYAALVVLWMWTLEAIGSRAIRALLSVTIAIGLGAVLEWYQLSVPGRFGSFADVLLNSAGAIVGLVLALLLI